MWLELLKKLNTKDKDMYLDDIMNRDDSLNEEEIDFISKNEDELK